MTGFVLALLEHPVLAPSVLAAAGGLAGLMGGARVAVLAVRTSPAATILPTEEVLTAPHAQAIAARETQRIAGLRAAFTAWAAGRPQATWEEVEGLAEEVVAERGKRADILVMGRLGRPGGGADRPALRAALFDTDRPVLVAPPRPAADFGQRVAIAWRDDARTIRAVLAALRLLSPATEVHVLAGRREAAAEPILPAILAEHGIAARLHVLPVGTGVFAAALLAKAAELQADLLVMGAYVHSPWRQLLLGGVTRHVLAEADLPVLMRH